MKKGWEWKRLGDLFQIGSSKRVLKSEWTTSGVPFYRGREVTRLAAAGYVENDLFISEEHYRLLSMQHGVPKPGDIVITAIGTIGNAHVVRSSDRFYFKDASVLWMKRTTDVNSVFVNYWLKSTHFLEQLDKGNGATVDTLTIQKLQSIAIPLPPLPEQRRIVGILDEAFAGLATAEANAARNLQNAREIFDSHLHAVFSQRGATRPPVPLRQCVEDIATGPFGSLLHKSDYEVGGIPLVNPINIEGEAIVPDDRKAVGRETAERLSRYVLKENDVVIGRRGEIGRCAVITSVEAGWICGTGCFVIRPTADTNPHYLAHLLRSKPYREQLEAVSKRATMPSISNEDLGNLDIRIPPLPQQKMVLRSLNLVSAETQRVATLQQRKIAALGELKKSLLHLAFSGGL